MRMLRAHEAANYLAVVQNGGLASLKGYFGAKGDGTTDDTAKVVDAVESGLPIWVPPGVYRISTEVQLLSSTFMVGAGRGVSVFRNPDPNVNGLVVRGTGHYLAHFTVDLVNGDDTSSGSCFLFGSMQGGRATEGTFHDLEARNANRQGFTGSPLLCSFKSLYAYNCGHRGFNFSQYATGNEFVNIHAKDCGYSGFILGVASDRNTVTNLFVSGTRISPDVLVTEKSSHNIFTNVIIGPRDPLFDVTDPYLSVEAACEDNQFHNFVLNGAQRGILIRDADLAAESIAAVEAIEAALSIDLGFDNGPHLRNIFSNFKIFGNGASGATGIYIEKVDGEGHGCDGDVFSRFYITDVDHAARDVEASPADQCTNFTFEDFKFGTVSGRKWYLPVGKGHRCVNYPGVTGVGSLATATTELPGQPTYSTGDVITNDYPFPVQVNVGGQSGSGANTIINGVSYIAPGTSGEAGNGQFILQPGQTIRCDQGATGTGAWRWFSL